MLLLFKSFLYIPQSDPGLIAALPQAAIPNPKELIHEQLCLLLGATAKYAVLLLTQLGRQLQLSGERDSSCWREGDLREAAVSSWQG